MTYALFGADAARQRAEAWAEEHGGFVLRLGDQADPRRFGLDLFCRDANGIQYSHVAVTVECYVCAGEGGKHWSDCPERDT